MKNHILYQTSSFGIYLAKSKRLKSVYFFFCSFVCLFVVIHLSAHNHLYKRRDKLWKHIYYLQRTHFLMLVRFLFYDIHSIFYVVVRIHNCLHGKYQRLQDDIYIYINTYFPPLSFAFTQRVYLFETFPAD